MPDDKSLEKLKMYFKGQLTEVEKNKIDNALQHDEALRDSLTEAKLFLLMEDRLKVAAMKENVQKWKKPNSTFPTTYIFLLIVLGISLIIVYYFLFVNNVSTTTDETKIENPSGKLKSETSKNIKNKSVEIIAENKTPDSISYISDEIKIKPDSKHFDPTKIIPDKLSLAIAEIGLKQLNNYEYEQIPLTRSESDILVGQTIITIDSLIKAKKYTESKKLILENKNKVPEQYLLPRLANVELKLQHVNKAIIAFTKYDRDYANNESSDINTVFYLMQDVNSNYSLIMKKLDTIIADNEHSESSRAKKIKSQIVHIIKTGR